MVQFCNKAINRYHQSSSPPTTSSGHVSRTSSRTSVTVSVKIRHQRRAIKPVFTMSSCCKVCIPCTRVPLWYGCNSALPSTVANMGGASDSFTSPIRSSMMTTCYDVGRRQSHCLRFVLRLKPSGSARLISCSACAGSMPGMANVSPPPTMIAMSAMLVSFRIVSVLYCVCISRIYVCFGLYKSPFYYLCSCD